MIVGSHVKFLSALKSVVKTMSSKRWPAELNEACVRHGLASARLLQPVKLGGASEATVTGEIKKGEMLAFVWAGTGCDVTSSSNPKQLDAAGLVQALKASKAPPRVVVVWMKYGAESLAKQLETKLEEAIGPRVAPTIIWIKHDPHEANGLSLLEDTIWPALNLIIDGSKTVTDLLRLFRDERCGDATAGCIGAKPNRSIEVRQTEGEPVVMEPCRCVVFRTTASQRRSPSSSMTARSSVVTLVSSSQPMKSGAWWLT